MFVLEESDAEYERERDSERERQRERQRGRETERERERETERELERELERERHTQRKRDRDRDRDTRTQREQRSAHKPQHPLASSDFPLAIIDNQTRCLAEASLAGRCRIPLSPSSPGNRGTSPAGMLRTAPCCFVRRRDKGGCCPWSLSARCLGGGGEAREARAWPRKTTVSRPGRF